MYIEEKRFPKQWLIVIGAIIGLLVVGGYGKKQLDIRHQKEQLQEIVQNEDAAAQSYFPVTKEEEALEQGNLVTYIPNNSQGEPIAIISEKMEEYKQAVRDKVVDADENLVFIKAVKKDADATIDEVIIEDSSYYLSDYKYTPQEVIKIDSMYLDKETYERVNLNDLFTDQLAAKQILFELIVKSVMSEDEDGAKQAAVKELFSTKDWETIPYQLTDTHLEIDLKQMNNALGNVSIDWKYLMPIINQKFTTGLLLTAFNNYQAEIEKNKNRKMIALTFDDGPRKQTTGTALDLLAKYNAKATFFMLGQNVPGNEELVQRMVAEGHQLANHSYNHPQLTSLTPAQIKQQIYDTQDLIKQASGGVESNAIRPPYGAYNHKVAAAAQIPAINWSIDTLDWQSHDPAKIAGIVKEYAYDGAIVLMHDIHQTTIDALPEMLAYLDSEGYEMVTVDELMNYKPLNPMTVYFDRKDSISYEN